MSGSITQRLRARHFQMFFYLKATADELLLHHSFILFSKINDPVESAIIFRLQGY